MMQLYKTLLMGNAADISILEKQVLQESDTVLSLIAKSCTEVGNNWTLSFDISSLHTSNELRLAELRIHLPSFEKSHNVTVNLFHTRKDHERHFLGSFKTDPFTPGSSWKVFNLTKMLQCYLNQGETCTVGEYIEAKDMTHIVSATNSRKTRTDDHSSGAAFTIDRVMLVVFAKDKAPIHHSPSHNKEKHSNIMADHATRVASIWRHRRKISV
ncbi:nodal homolog 2-A-like [Discoglossus pictus]